ncbi:MAG: hypothetical protein PUF39_02250 [Prevotellaceae bacterium]|nr:hypothetical protein [Prevotellaceae bacterium]
MRKLLFFALICTVLFNACSQDDLQMRTSEGITVSSANTSELFEDIPSLSIPTLIKSNGFEKLNSIPALIAKKMDKQELNVWKKLSQKYYINYDIVGTSYYRKNKGSFLLSLEKLYEEAVSKGNGPVKLVLLTRELLSDQNGSFYVLPEDTTDVGSPEEPEIADDSTAIDNTPLHEEMRVRYYASTAESDFGIEFGCWLYVDGTRSNYTCTWTSLSWEAYPMGSSFEGYTTMEPDRNTLHLGAHGYIKYNTFSVKKSVRIDDDQDITYTIPKQQ